MFSNLDQQMCYLPGLGLSSISRFRKVSLYILSALTKGTRLHKNMFYFTPRHNNYELTWLKTDWLQFSRAQSEAQKYCPSVYMHRGFEKAETRSELARLFFKSLHPTVSLRFGRVSGAQFTFRRPDWKSYETDDVINAPP